MRWTTIRLLTIACKLKLYLLKMLFILYILYLKDARRENVHFYSILFSTIKFEPKFYDAAYDGHQWNN